MRGKIGKSHLVLDQRLIKTKEEKYALAEKKRTRRLYSGAMIFSYSDGRIELGLFYHINYFPFLFVLLGMINSIFANE